MRVPPDRGHRLGLGAARRTQRRLRASVGLWVAGAAIVALPASSGSSASAGAASPRCFGAAARDPQHPCENPRLTFAVRPSPRDALITPNSGCTVVQTVGLVQVCAFGSPPARARQSVALLGDSHARHWRATLEVVAQAKRWRALSITRSGCPFSTTVRDIPPPARRQCVRLNREIPSWFAAHPEVHTVFVAELTGEAIIAPRGLSAFRAAEAGFVEAWRTLPRSVTHIIVIRDNPKMHDSTLPCIQLAMARHQRADLTCAVPRSRLQDDPAAAAAQRLRSGRVRIVDLSHFLCDQRWCYPVIGGALVYRDSHHLTQTFAVTLGPFMLRQVNWIMRSWR